MIHSPRQLIANLIYKLGRELERFAWSMNVDTNPRLWREDIRDDKNVAGLLTVLAIAAAGFLVNGVVEAIMWTMENVQPGWMAGLFVVFMVAIALLSLSLTVVGVVTAWENS